MVVVTNKIELIGFSVAGEKAKKVVRAVSSASHSYRSKTEFGADLQFYRQSELLAEIPFQGSRILVAGQEEYVDRGRTLERLDRDLSRRSPQRLRL